MGVGGSLYNDLYEEGHLLGGFPNFPCKVPIALTPLHLPSNASKKAAGIFRRSAVVCCSDDGERSGDSNSF